MKNSIFCSIFTIYAKIIIFNKIKKTIIKSKEKHRKFQ